MSRRLNQQEAEALATATPPPSALVNVRDRVREFRRIAATELQDNTGNWREHPLTQRQVLRSVMEQVGIAGALLVYESERNGGALTLVDGHLRKGDYPGVEWPCLVLDVTDAEADLLLATHDPITQMAATSRDQLQVLLQGLQGQGQELDAALASIAAANGLELAHVEVPPMGAVGGTQAPVESITLKVQVGNVGERVEITRQLAEFLAEHPDWQAVIAQ
jgi:hypothetical protein